VILSMWTCVHCGETQCHWQMCACERRDDKKRRSLKRERQQISDDECVCPQCQQKEGGGNAN
jgi:hypothetical protein